MRQNNNLNISFRLDYFTCCNEKTELCFIKISILYWDDTSVKYFFSERKASPADNNLHALDSNLKYLKDIDQMIL